MKDHIIKILLCHPNPAVSYALAAEANYFQDLSFCYASNGKEALQLWKKHDFQLVMTDVFLEYFNGIELMQFIRNERPDMPIWVLTASTNPFLEKKAEIFEVERIVTQPFDPIKICESIKATFQSQSYVPAPLY